MSDVATRAHFDRPDDSRFVIERVQDVEPVLEWNAMLRSQEQRSDWGRHIGSVPNVVFEKWLNEEFARGNTTILWDQREQHKLLLRKLKDSENWKFRVDK
jgi:hypothetical protein